MFRCWLTVSEEQRIHYLGTPGEGETLTVTIEHSGQKFWAQRFAALDPDGLTRAVAAVSAPHVDVRGTTVRLTEAVVDDGQVLVTTIPAEDGWSAKVNGKAAKLSQWGGAYLALELPCGTYDITLRYTPPGLYPSLVLAGIALLWAAVILRKKNKA